MSREDRGNDRTHQFYHSSLRRHVNNTHNIDVDEIAYCSFCPEPGYAYRFLYVLEETKNLDKPVSIIRQLGRQLGVPAYLDIVTDWHEANVDSLYVYEPTYRTIMYPPDGGVPQSHVSRGREEFLEKACDRHMLGHAPGCPRPRGQRFFFGPGGRCGGFCCT